MKPSDLPRIPKGPNPNNQERKPKRPKPKTRQPIKEPSPPLTKAEKAKINRDRKKGAENFAKHEAGRKKRAADAQKKKEREEQQRQDKLAAANRSSKKVDAVKSGAVEKLTATRDRAKYFMKKLDAMRKLMEQEDDDDFQECFDDMAAVRKILDRISRKKPSRRVESSPEPSPSPKKPRLVRGTRKSTTEAEEDAEEDKVEEDEVDDGTKPPKTSALPEEKPTRVSPRLKKK